MGRVVELKNEMVEKEFSEYHYMDDVIQDLKLTPVSIFNTFSSVIVNRTNATLKGLQKTW